MKERFSFGTPERRRLAVRFGYDMRPSFWQEVRSNAHLVIAAIGTAALLGVAAVALWLALPAADRQVAASAEQTIPAVPVKTTKIATAEIPAAPTPQAAPPKSNAVPPKVEAAEATIPALAANDPRWTEAEPKAASAPADTDQKASGQAENDAQPSPDKAEAFAQASGDTNASAELSKVAAPAAAAAGTPDRAQTAAIPKAQPATADDPAKVQPSKADGAGSGRIVRAVTMRSGPKKSAAAIETIPARTSVQVLSCKQWCQIVHNGKTGWIYKSYIKT